MVRCFMTGIQCEIDDAFVLNRRAARQFLDVLKDRAKSLQLAIEQLAPLDEKEVYSHSKLNPKRNFTPMQHRLVCKAVADALALGYPEINLFQRWPEYQAYVHRIRAQGANSQGGNHENQSPK